MDPIGHTLWSYVAFHWTGHPWLAVLAGLFPDVVAFGPQYAYNVLHGARTFSEIDDERTVPDWIRRHRIRWFHLGHSLVTSLPIAGLVGMMTGMWWLLAWPLHIAFDLISHNKENATPYLWPLSEHRIHWLMWTDKRWLALTYGALALFVAF